jgi:hypothetical protein
MYLANPENLACEAIFFSNATIPLSPTSPSKKTGMDLIGFYSGGIQLSRFIKKG